MKKRIPRPKGLTQASYKYNKHKKQFYLKKLINIIALNYINSEYMVQGEPMNTYQVAEHYGIPFNMLTNAINKRVQEMASYICQEDLVSSHRSILGRVFLGSEKDRALIHNQLQRLLAAQGDTYRPYVSAEVNNALKLMLASTKNLIDLTDRIIPKNAEIMNIMINQNASQTEVLDTYKATQLIREEIGKALPPQDNKALLTEGPSNPESIYQNLISEHNLKEMPNVKANKADAGANIGVTVDRIIEDPSSVIPTPNEDSDAESLSDYEEL